MYSLDERKKYQNNFSEEKKYLQRNHQQQQQQHIFNQRKYQRNQDNDSDKNFQLDISEAYQKAKLTTRPTFTPLTQKVQTQNPM